MSSETCPFAPAHGRNQRSHAHSVTRLPPRPLANKAPEGGLDREQNESTRAREGVGADMPRASSKGIQASSGSGPMPCAPE